MARGRAFNIYLNDDDFSDLEYLKKFFGDSASAIIRSLIKSSASSIRKVASDNSKNTTLFPEIFELNDSDLIFNARTLNEFNYSIKRRLHSEIVFLLIVST